MEEDIEKIVQGYFNGENLRELLKRCNIKSEVLKKIFKSEV